MNVTFFKYQGTGNDFVMIDDRSIKIGNNEEFSSPDKIAALCDRRFGIGADGVIFLQNSDQHDFKMKYYNSDGHESTMCGNGGRCIVAFAKKLGLIDQECTFEAIDGLHHASIKGDDVTLQMKDVENIKYTEVSVVLDTGSPHFVTTINSGLDELDVSHAGAEIRNSPPFAQEGINVNFVQAIGENKIQVRTYERGVEDETYSCGTGVTASSIAVANISPDTQTYKVATIGGDLEVKFIKPDARTAHDVWLIGPALEVFEGTIEL